MTGAGVAGTFSTPKWPNGKYDNPDLIKRNLEQKGLRGVRFYDATDPAKIVPLSEWSCDQGDPKRPIQTGSGTHRSYYDGGRYAYLDTAPDNSFTRMESSVRHYSNGIQIIDVADPSQPKFVANWWLPGQREGEEEAYKQWREYGDRKSFTTLHGPMYVPRKVEDGGRYGYSAYSALGMMVHDLSDIANPKLVGRFYPKVELGAIPFHTIDVARLDRGFVISNPEVLNPDCNEPYQPSWIIDVRDPTKPQPISQLPVPAAAAGRALPRLLRQARALRAAQSAAPEGAGQAQPELHGLHVLQCGRCSCTTSRIRRSRATPAISSRRRPAASTTISAIRAIPTTSSSNGIAS